jgi:hypothetical protein
MRGEGLGACLEGTGLELRGEAQHDLGEHSLQ